MPPSDITAADVGEMVVRGIEQDAPYILTHTGVWKSMEKRLTALKAASDARESA